MSSAGSACCRPPSPQPLLAIRPAAPPTRSAPCHSPIDVLLHIRRTGIRPELHTVPIPRPITRSAKYPDPRNLHIEISGPGVLRPPVGRDDPNPHEPAPPLRLRPGIRPERHIVERLDCPPPDYVVTDPFAAEPVQDDPHGGTVRAIPAILEQHRRAARRRRRRRWRTIPTDVARSINRPHRPACTTSPATTPASV